MAWDIFEAFPANPHDALPVRSHLRKPLVWETVFYAATALICDEEGASRYDVLPKSFDANEASTSDDKYGYDNQFETLYTRLEYLTANGQPYEGYETTI